MSHWNQCSSIGPKAALEHASDEEFMPGITEDKPTKKYKTNVDLEKEPVRVHTPQPDTTSLEKITNAMKDRKAVNYKNAASAGNFDYYLEEYWKKGICESCDEMENNPKPRRCEYAKSCRVHDWCSYLCDVCAVQKTKDAEQGSCAYCYQENLRAYSGSRVRAGIDQT